MVPPKLDGNVSTTGFTATISQDPVGVHGNWKATVVENSVEAKCVQYSEEHDYLFVGYADGGIRGFKDMKLAVELYDKDIEKSSMSVTAIKHRPVSKNYPITNTLICSYSTGYVKCWQYNFGDCTFTMAENRLITNVAYHPRLAKFVTMGDNKKIFLYDEDTKRQERVLSATDVVGATDGHTGVVTTACFHPKSVNELLTGSLDNTVQFWDTRQPHAIRNISGITITGDGIDFTPKGSEFITFSNQADKPLRLWDYASAKEIKVIEPDKYKNVPLICGKFLNKATFVCGGGSPNLVRMVDANTYQSNAIVSGIPKVSQGFTVGAANAAGVPKFAFCGEKKLYEISPK